MSFLFLSYHFRLDYTEVRSLNFQTTSVYIMLRETKRRTERGGSSGGLDHQHLLIWAARRSLRTPAFRVFPVAIHRPPSVKSLESLLKWQLSRAPALLEGPTQQAWGAAWASAAQHMLPREFQGTKFKDHSLRKPLSLTSKL